MKPRVLVVDDEQDIRELLKFYLNKEGYEVIEAANGEEALTIFENEYIDLGIIDVMMPVMDGIEATRTIRSLARKDAQNIPIIAVTAKNLKMFLVLCLLPRGKARISYVAFLQGLMTMLLNLLILMN